MKIKTDKRKQIIDTSINLFSHTHNVKRVSLETIAEAAHVSPTTIYNYFGTRENLVYEVVKTMINDVIERNRSIIYSGMTFRQKLMTIVSGKQNIMSRLNNEIISKMLSQDKTIAPFIDEIYEKEIRPLWQEMLTDGKKQGYIDPELDMEALMLYIDVLKTGFTARSDILQQFKDRADMIKKISHLMFYGFLKKDIDLFSKEDKSTNA